MIVVLAGSYPEAARYAASIGLRPGRFRYASSADTIRGLRVSEIHELPSYSKRRDTHAIEAALRSSVRGVAERVRVDEAPPPPKPAEPGQVPGQMSLDDALADSNASESKAEPEPKPAAKPKRKSKPRPTTKPQPASTGSSFFGEQ